MKTAPKKRTEHPIRKEAMRKSYDFSGAVVGKYARRYAEGTNMVQLDPDVAIAFPDSKSVNEALRSLVRIAERSKAASYPWREI